MDLIVGDGVGALLYYKNVGNATTPVFVDMFVHDLTTCENLASYGDYETVPDPTYCQSNLDAMVGCYGACHGGNPLHGLAIERNGVQGLQAAPKLADFDGDGDLDLVVGGYFVDPDDAILYFANTGTARMPKFAIVGDDLNPFDAVERYGGTAGSTIAIGDIDGDGTPQCPCETKCVTAFS